MIDVCVANKLLPDWPRGLSEPLAAAYVGLSPASFRKFYNAGEAPKPIHFPGKRIAWLRDDLDAWLDQLAGRAAPLLEKDEWAG
jgi:predicted DNA-binding transcriptional regulator AlpA